VTHNIFCSRAHLLCFRTQALRCGCHKTWVRQECSKSYTSRKW